MIKFRIFNKKEQVMIYSGATPTMLSSFFKSTAVFNTRDNSQYQQITGLKDINGNDIYDGDCVRFEVHDGATVIWNETEARFEFKANKHYCESDICQPCEVIGNIHENPELLIGA